MAESFFHALKIELIYVEDFHTHEQAQTAVFERIGNTKPLCVWGIGVEGRKGLLSLSPTQSASSERCLAGLRALSKRGL